MQAACSLETRKQTGILQSLVKYSPAQILVEGSQIDRPGEVSQQREALNCDIRSLRRLQRRYEKVSAALVYWGKDKDEEESFDAQDEASDLLYLT
jgi:hypothetical protein